MTEHDDRPPTEQELDYLARATRVGVELRRGATVWGARTYLSAGFDPDSTMPVRVQRVGVANAAALLGTRLVRDAYPPEPGEFDAFGDYPHQVGDTVMIGPDTVLSADRATILHNGHLYQRAATVPDRRVPAHPLPRHPDNG